MLSSNKRDNFDDMPLDLDKDFHLVVSRTFIDFNKKKCKLVTFKDVTINHRLKYQEEKNQVKKKFKNYIEDVIINPLNPTLRVLQMIS